MAALWIMQSLVPGIVQTSLLERSVPHVSEVPTLLHEELCTPLIPNTVTRTKCTPNSINNSMGRTKLQNANAIANAFECFSDGKPRQSSVLEPEVP